MKLIVLGIVGAVLFLGGAVFFKNVSVDNQEIELRTEAEAQNKKCEAYFDKMWKILQQKAGVTSQYKDGFKEIYIGLMEGRYGKGDGSLMKWVQEANPTFDASLYKDLMNSIEIQREGFFQEQERLIDIKREHQNLMKKFPSSLFIDSDVKELDIKIITSAKTNEVYTTGEENDVDLYPKETKDSLKK